MERSSIVPHISWNGPAPDREADAYLLAMLLRIYCSGLDFEDENKRDKLLHPSVLTTENMPIIATMYAFYQDKMREENIGSVENMLKLVKGSDEDEAVAWIADNDNKDAIKHAEAALLEFIDTPGSKGFSAFG